jgi:hypothetical protein
MVEGKHTQEALKKVFDSFDKDKNGFIDISEIKALSKELGHEVSDTDVQTIFAEIDTNKDGKISFGEFAIWWNSGKATKLEGLVYYQLKAHKLLSKAHSDLTRLGQSLDTKYDNTVEAHYFGIQAGESEHKTKLDFKAAFGGTEEKLLFEHTLGKLGRPWDQNAIVLSFKSPNPETAKDGLKDLIDTALQFAAFLPPEVGQVISSLTFDYFTTADTVGVAISTTDETVKSLARTLSDVGSSVVGEETGGLFHIHLGLKNDFASIFKNSQDGVRKSIVEELIESFLFEVHAKISPQILSFARQQYYASKAGGGKSGPEIIPLLLKGSKLSFKLAELKAETLLPTLQGLGLGGPLSQIPALGDLLELAKGSGVDQMVQGIPQASAALDFFREHIKANVHLIVRTEKTIASLHIHTSGIREIFDYLFSRE